MNKFEQLADDLTTGKLTLTHVQIAIRSSVRRRKDIPEGIKSILCGKGPEYAGLIYKMFKPMQEVIGTVELAYRRGAQKEDVIG